MKKDIVYDVGVVGAGIVGLAHAYFAAAKGLKVVVIEKDEKARGASIRNFGLIWPIGQQVHTFERAIRSRNTWADLATKAGFWVKDNGSIHLASSKEELDVLQEFQNTLGDIYHTSMLSTSDVANLSPYLISKNKLGGLYSPNELTVNSREALPIITNYLRDELGVDFFFNTRVQHIVDNKITCSVPELKLKVNHTIITGGSQIDTLFPDLFSGGNLIRTKLQMLKAVDKKERKNLGPTLCGGLTLNHYKSFESLSSLKKLQLKFNEDHPDLIKFGIHVMVSQNNLGEFIIGDSHEYDNVVSPFNKEMIDNSILKYLESFFKVSAIRIVERWKGVYAKSTNGETEIVLRPNKDVTIVNGLGGAGMTLSFGLAEEIINRITNT